MHFPHIGLVIADASKHCQRHQKRRKKAAKPSHHTLFRFDAHFANHLSSDAAIAAHFLNRGYAASQASRKNGMVGRNFLIIVISFMIIGEKRQRYGTCGERRILTRSCTPDILIVHGSHARNSIGLRYVELRCQHFCIVGCGAVADRRMAELQEETVDDPI